MGTFLYWFIEGTDGKIIQSGHLQKCLKVWLTICGNLVKSDLKITKSVQDSMVFIPSFIGEEGNKLIDTQKILQNSDDWGDFTGGTMMKVGRFIDFDWISFLEHSDLDNNIYKEFTNFVECIKKHDRNSMLVFYYQHLI